MGSQKNVMERVYEFTEKCYAMSLRVRRKMLSNEYMGSQKNDMHRVFGFAEGNLPKGLHAG